MKEVEDPVFEGCAEEDGVGQVEQVGLNRTGGGHVFRERTDSGRTVGNRR